MGKTDNDFIIATKIKCNPFALNLSKGCSRSDGPVLSAAEGLTTNGIFISILTT